MFPCHFTITFRVQISILKSNLFNTLFVCSIKIYNDAIWTSDWIHLVDLCMLSSFQFSPLSSPNWCFNSEKLANVFGIGIFQMLLSVGLSDTALNLQKKKKKKLNIRVQCSWIWSLISYTCTRHLCKTAQWYAEWRSFRRWKWNRSCKKARQAAECLVVYSGFYVVCYGNLAITPEIHGSRKILHRSTIFSLSYTQELISFNF